MKESRNKHQPTVFQELRAMLVHKEKSRMEAKASSSEDVTHEDDDGKVESFSIPVDHDATSVFVKGWLCPGSDYPPIVVVHDLAESVELYRDFAHALVEAGFNVYGFDLRGHGRSGRLLGHIPRFESLVSDLLQVVAWVRFKSKRRAPVIIGQGLGATISAYFQAAHPKMIHAAILVAPNVAQRWQWSQRLTLSLLAEVFPHARLPQALLPSFGGSLEAHDRRADKRGYLGISAHFAKELILAFQGFHEHLGRIRQHTLILTPELDYERGSLEKALSCHKDSRWIDWQEIPGSSNRQPITTNSEDLKLVLNKLISWLKEHDLSSSTSSKENPHG